MHKPWTSKSREIDTKSSGNEREGIGSNILICNWICELNKDKCKERLEPRGRMDGWMVVVVVADAGVMERRGTPWILFSQSVVRCISAYIVLYRGTTYFPCYMNRFPQTSRAVRLMHSLPPAYDSAGT